MHNVWAECFTLQRCAVLSKNSPKDSGTCDEPLHVDTLCLTIFLFIACDIGVCTTAVVRQQTPFRLGSTTPVAWHAQVA